MPHVLSLVRSRVPTNLVVALMMLGPVGNNSLTMDDRVVLVFGMLAGLTGVATLVQVKYQISCFSDLGLYYTNETGLVRFGNAVAPGSSVAEFVALCDFPQHPHVMLLISGAALATGEGSEG